MGAHFWPSLYPGLIIGLLYGLYVGGWKNAVLGTAGGLLGALAFGAALPSLLAMDGFLPLMVLLAAALVGAVAAVHGIRRLIASRQGPGN